MSIIKKDLKKQSNNIIKSYKYLKAKNNKKKTKKKHSNNSLKLSNPK